MLNIVVPMAGRGSRFAKEGYALPKPLIEIHGRPMIEYVIHNIAPAQTHRFIFLCLQKHLEKYDLEDQLHRFALNSVVVPVSHVTEGAACTVLLAQSYIDSSDPLMIANSDQYVDTDINQYLSAGKGADGLIMTMTAHDAKWSFLRYDDRRQVQEVREKEVISDEATVGIYNFSKGSDFVRYAHKMIRKNKRVQNEFYVAPVYNEMIEEEKSIAFYNVGSVESGMYGLGIPSDLNKFIKNPLSKRVFQKAAL